MVKPRAKLRPASSDRSEGVNERTRKRMRRELADKQSRRGVWVPRAEIASEIFRRRCLAPSKSVPQQRAPQPLNWELSSKSSLDAQTIFIDASAIALYKPVRRLLSSPWVRCCSGPLFQPHPSGLGTKHTRACLRVPFPQGAS